jgi:hypothetical protein
VPCKLARFRKEEDLNFFLIIPSGNPALFFSGVVSLFVRHKLIRFLSFICEYVKTMCVCVRVCDRGEKWPEHGVPNCAESFTMSQLLHRV